jgi:hypothetical protein
MSYRIENSDIVISGFENGISNNPYQGIADMRAVNIISVPGEASVNFKSSSNTYASVSATVVSADAGTNYITYTGATSPLVAGMAIVFTGASLPGGLTAATPYWVGSVGGGGGGTFKAYTNYKLTTAVTISGTGTGTFATIDMGLPKYFTRETYNNSTYLIDANGRAWLADTKFTYLGNTNLTNASGNGIAIYKTYLFVFRNARVDYVNLVGTPTWVYQWNPATGATDNTDILNNLTGVNSSHQALVGQDDVLYYCDATFIGSLREKSGQTFDPTNTATYVFTKKALALPATDNVNCIEELGTNLLVGGSKNYIYPWDRIATSFRYPILLAEDYITNILTVNTNAYVFAGARGRIYKTNGSQAEMYIKVPDHLAAKPDPIMTWGGAGYNRNQLYFGLSATDNAGNALSVYGGLWAVDLTTDALRCVTQMSHGTWGGYVSAIHSGILTGAGISLFSGWKSATSTYGVDSTGSDPFDTYIAYVDSDMIPVGTFLSKKTFEWVEYKLATPLTTGDGVYLYYRTNMTEAFTAIGESTTAGLLSEAFNVNFENVQWIQIRAMLKGASGGSYTRLTEMRIR